MATLNSSLPKTADVIPLRAKATHPKKATQAKTPKAKKPRAETPLETLKHMIEKRDAGSYRTFLVSAFDPMGKHHKADLNYDDLPSDRNSRRMGKNVFFIRSPTAPCDRILKKYTGGFYEWLSVFGLTHDNSVEKLSLEHVSHYQKPCQP